MPSSTCKNRKSLSPSICSWNTLKRIQKSEEGLNFIIFIYSSPFVSFLKTIPALFGRGAAFSSLQMNISMLCALEFGAEGEGDGKRTISLHRCYALQEFPLKNPLQLAVSDSIRYCHIWKMESLSTKYFYALNWFLTKSGGLVFFGGVLWILVLQWIEVDFIKTLCKVQLERLMPCLVTLSIKITFMFFWGFSGNTVCGSKINWFINTVLFVI